MASVPLDQLCAPASPLQRGGKGYFKMVVAEAVIHGSIIDIISTKCGERVNRPQYGCRVHDLVWEPADDVTKILAEQHCKDALARWESRIVVQSVKAAYDDTDSTSLVKLLLDVAWQLRAARTGNLFHTNFDLGFRR